ncbi:MAG TPA: hypothetical protein VEN12_11335 [Verrucomicrobiae bacterium]|nr:hypothetical protein [Verrucomicrobiae bacterium]
MSLNTVLIVVALIAFALAVIGFTWRKVDLIAVGLAVWSLSELIGRLSSLNISTILLLLAFVAFVAAAIGWRYRKLNLIAIGLGLWVLSLLI